MAWSVGKPFFSDNNKYNNLKFLLQHCYWKTKVGPQPFFKKIVSFFYNMLIYKYIMSVKQVFAIGPYIPLNEEYKFTKQEFFKVQSIFELSLEFRTFFNKKTPIFVFLLCKNPKRVPPDEIVKSALFI